MGELDRKRCKVDIEDLIRLAVAFGPDGAKEKIEEMAQRIEDIFSGLDRAFASPKLDGFHDCLNKLDGVISFMQSITGEELQGFSTIRSILGLLQGGRGNLESILSIVSSFLPSGIRSLLGEAGRLFNTVMGLVTFLKNFNPRNLLQGFLGGIFRGAFGKILGGSVGKALSSFLSGTPVGQLLGSAFASAGTGLAAVASAVFGSTASTVSVAPKDTLGGGFEGDDGIVLSEKHIRGEEDE